MNVKKAKWSPVKEILFTYLAINKIMYWFNTVTALNQSDLGNVGRTVFMRVLNQDLILIIGVTAFFFLDKLIELKKSKYNSNIWGYVILYAIGYVVLIGIAFMYMLILNLIFAAQYFSLGELVRGFISFMPNYTLGYLVVAVVLNLKYYFKTKKTSEDAPAVQNTDDKLAMLKRLLDDGVLTQEEFDCKKEKLRGM